MKPQCLSSRLNWVPQPPPPLASVGGGDALAGWGEVGGPNSDDWIETLVLCIVYSFTRRTHSVFALVTYY
jgi:hypothetical protein